MEISFIKCVRAVRSTYQHIYDDDVDRLRRNSVETRTFLPNHHTVCRTQANS